MNENKIIILGDVHFDVGNGNQTVLENQLQFFNNQLFPYMKENNIKTIIQLGDLMDNRNKVSVNVTHYLKKDFFDVMKREGISLYTLIGNHDIYHKDTREIHSLGLFDIIYDNFYIINDIQTLNISDKNLLIVPWVLPDEKYNFEDYLDTNYIFGHFETNGVEMVKGINCNSSHAFGMDSFKGIKTFSGHFHLRRYYETSNIYYVGTPNQINWSDYNEQKGFHVLDIPSGNLEFIENIVSTKHIKIILNSEDKSIDVLGFKDILKFKIDSKLDYSIFKKHKAKIYIDKDNVFNKAVIEKLDTELQSYRIELLEKEDTEQELEEKSDSENRVDFDVVSTIKENIKTDYQKQVFNEIYTEALLNLKD
jgi:DNA repair exonuclease SbcCD nuclease subunit